MNDNAVSDRTDEAPQLSTDVLVRVARYHRWVIAVALAEVALWVGFLVFSAARGESISDGLGFPTALTFILGAVGGIFTFLLYWSLRGPVPALIMGLGAVPPCIGLLVLVVVHGAAVAALRSNGVEVGMFGADLDSVPMERDDPDDEDEGW